MQLKVFVPDWDDHYTRTYCTPMIHPFLKANLSETALIRKYGSWILDILLVDKLEDCDVAMLMYTLNYYYQFKKTEVLQTINRQTAAKGKILICAAKGDEGITPRLRQFHLYRWGGYASKNNGNEFAMPVFIADPLHLYANGKLMVQAYKTIKPLIGFCGQGKAGLLKLSKDITSGLYKRLSKLLGARFYDDEALISSTYIRSRLLDKLEQSALTDTVFIRWEKYRNGIKTKEKKRESNQQFYNNILATQYTFCYRGAGNFSVRLFETLACGRIPIIVMSNNTLPLPQLVNWSKFPVIQPSEQNRIAEIVSVFHSNLSNEQFVKLQQEARQIWEQYLTYGNFMRIIVDGYIQHTEA